MDEVLLVEAMDTCEGAGSQAPSGEVEGDGFPAGSSKKRHIDDFFGRQ